jgi:hypothetical protein
MATIDRYSAGEHADRPARERSIAWLAESTTWFVAAIAGMVIIFIGLAIDAYRHNNGAGEESLLSFSNPGHLVAAIGIAVTSVAVLTGLSVAMLRGVETAEHAIRRFVPVTAAWVLMAAAGIGSITYIGASGVTVGHSHGDDASAAADDHSHDNTGGPEGGDAGVAAALEDEGIRSDDSGTNIDEAKNVEGALTQGASGQPGGAHDHGKQPTFTQLTTMSDSELLPLFPEGTVSAEDLPTLKAQVLAVRGVAERIQTPQQAIEAGYVNTTSDVPYMGQHYLNFDYVRDGLFDPNKPEGLLFSKIDGGEEKLVGVWFLLIPGVGGITRDAEPAGFASDLDLWHAHIGLCLVGLSGASEGETRESCEAKGGRFTADLRWMMHVWVAPETTENPDGIMAYLNSDLFDKQTAAKQTGGNPSGTVAD